MVRLTQLRVAVYCSVVYIYSTIVQSYRTAISPERRLFDHLMRNYDPASRPVLNASDPVSVNFSISLNKIHDLVEKNQTLITHVWVFEEWIDEMLHWNPEKFGGLTTVVIPTRMIWLPDLYIFNNADKGSGGYVVSIDSHVLAHHTGQISWTIPLIIRSSCSVDVRYFPFDNQHCFVTFGSWVYEQSQLDLVLKEGVVDVSPLFSENNELVLRNATLSREIVTSVLVPGRYPQITMYVSVRRRPVFYAYTVIAPTLVLCILTLFSFLLPCDNGDKVGIGLTVFLSLYVLQLAIAENVPEANSLPLVGLFLTLVMTLNAISLVFATLVINIKKKGDRPNCPCVPDCILNFCKNILAKLTCTPFISFYDFYGFCELESQLAKTTPPASRDRHVTFRSYLDRTDTSTGGMATFRPKSKAASRGNPRLQTSHVTRADAGTGSVTSQQQSPRDPKYEWCFVAEVLDKLLFLLFLVAMMMTIVTSLIIIPWIHRND